MWNQNFNEEFCEQVEQKISPYLKLIYFHFQTWTLADFFLKMITP